ncbi:MAG: PopZ family protein [Candidatus Ochrobactrum gambitense]|nr:MAG: PopZ family protein [Candidatus Ochrobactrum gambitense]WEK15211.1 MAG: PopZ family protein [Candidatus Ochrobactrum gambitense]
MAQTSSASREPSMEEILASIRRIIEDSDVSRHPVSTTANFPLRGEVAEFRRPEPAQEQPAAKAPVSRPAEKPAMMRDILKDEAVLRGPIDEPVKTSPALEPEIEEEEDDIVLDAQNDDRRAAEVMQAAPAATAPEAAAEDNSLEALDRSLEDGIAEAIDELLEPDLDEPMEAHVEPVVEPALEAPAEPAAPVAAAPEPLANASVAPHILSQVAERQVAAAFQDLSHVVRAEPRRSFDDIAAEILRPMLQDWLDNNLPTLVERLVREEIERVVRGDR